MKSIFKRHEKTRCSAFNRALALVLSLMLILSAFAVTGLSVGASSSDSRAIFGQGDYIYVDTSAVSNKNITEIKCHFYKAWPDNSGSYIDSIDMQKIDNNLFRCFFLADNVRYLKFKLNNADWWLNNNGNQNYSVDTMDRDNNPCQADGGTRCLTVYNTDSYRGSTRWLGISDKDPDLKMTSDNSARSYEKTAVNGSSMNASDLALVKGTFYDYYNNDEIRNGWISGLDGSERNYKDREPFTYFNRKVADYSRSNNSWNYPLYFGDFNRSGKTDGGPGPWPNGYTGAGVSSFNKYNAKANNSTSTSSGVNGVVTGLVDAALNNGKLTANGVTLPYFDSSSGSIIKQGYGAVVNSDFAFRKETRGQDTYYIYDSTNGQDNFLFTNLSGTPVANYYKNSNSVKDAASGFGNPTDGKGFFPFDTANTNAKDFGFGMKLEIPFRLNESGKTKYGNDVVFNFAGDDDLWVFVDGKLVLDMGGAHKMATGSINFTKRTVTVNSKDANLGDTLTTCTNNLNTIAYNANHNMTVFYMERGMIESNLKVEYNFDPLSANALSTKSVVEKVDINSGISSYFPQASQFGIDIKDATNNSNIKSYTQSEGETSDNKNIVSSDQSVTGNKVGDTLKVTQTINTNTRLKYDTTYTVTDVINNNQVSAGDGSEPSFVFKNSAGTVYDPTSYHVEFVNTPQIGFLTVSKNFYDKNNNLISGSSSQNKSFNMQILLDIDGSGVYKAYNLTSSNGIAYNGNFSIKGGESVTFSNIPAGVKYRITETVGSDFTEDNNGLVSGTITQGANSNSFTNRLKSAKLTVVKTFKDANGNVITGSDSQNREFNFTVVFNYNGTKSTQHFTLKGGESKTFNNLTVGTTYEVTEASGSDYTTTSQGSRGTITADGNTAAFVNQVSTTEFTVSKTFYDINGTDEIIGSDVRNKDFSFNLTLDVDGDGTNDFYTVKHNGSDVNVTPSGYSFTLKGGETVTFGNVPIGAKYKVTEAKSTDGSYTSTSQNASGEIASDGSAAHFYNTRAVTDLVVTKTYYDIDGTTKVVGSDPANEDFTFSLWLNLTDNNAGNIKYNTTPIEYTKTTANGTINGTLSTGSFTLKGGEQIVFHGLPVGGYWYVLEDVGGSNGKYTCECAGFFDDLKESNNRADFVNRRQSTQISVNKTFFYRQSDGYVDIKGNDPKNREFDYTLEFTNDIGKSFANRFKQVGYTKSDGESGTVTFSDSVASFKLKGGESITFSNVPIGADYKITETQDSGFIATDGNIRTGTTKSGVNDNNFRNERVDNSDINLTLKGKKFVDGRIPNANEKFTFTLTQVSEDGDVIGTPVTTTNSLGEFSFNLTYKFNETQVNDPDYYQCFYYEISEQVTPESPFVKYDSVKYYAEVEIDRSESKLSLIGCGYYKSLQDAIDLSGQIQEEDVVFNNNYYTGKVTVNKTDQSGSNVEDTQFALVKVSNEGVLDDTVALGNVLNDIAQNSTNRFTLGATDNNGKLIFDKLVLFKDGTGEYGANGWTSNEWAYEAQTYCLLEYSPSQGYNPTMTKYYFTLPKDGKYDVTLGYVDGAVLDPESGGSGMAAWFNAGFVIIGTAFLMLAGYVVYNRRSQKMRRARCIRTK